MVLDTLPIPNEAIAMVLEYLCPLDVLFLGSTCKHLRDIVNNRAKALSAPIIRREQARIETGLSVAGLRLDDAVRAYMLHRGPLVDRGFMGTSGRISTKYMLENGIDLGHTGYRNDRGFYRYLVEYLLHVNYLAHYKPRTFPADDDQEGVISWIDFPEGSPECMWTGSDCRKCKCLMCTSQRSTDQKNCCWVDAHVRLFKNTGWHDAKYALGFLKHIRSPNTENLVTDRQWLEMVWSVYSEPLEDRTDDEKSAATNALLAQVRQGLGGGPELQDIRLVMHKFIRLAGLPGVVRGERNIYVPRMDFATIRECLRPNFSQRRRGANLCARAAKEFCRRKEGPLAGQEKSLDPESLLVLAVIYKELHLVRGQVSLLQLADRPSERIRPTERENETTRELEGKLAAVNLRP